VTLSPGTFIVRDGPLVVDGGASLRGSDVSIYLKGPGANLTFANPVVIGLHTILKPTVSGTLYLRVNESASKLDDNHGSINVKIEAIR